MIPRILEAVEGLGFGRPDVSVKDKLAAGKAHLLEKKTVKLDFTGPIITSKTKKVRIRELTHKLIGRLRKETGINADAPKGSAAGIIKFSHEEGGALHEFEVRIRKSVIDAPSITLKVTAKNDSGGRRAIHGPIREQFEQLGYAQKKEPAQV